MLLSGNLTVTSLCCILTYTTSYPKGKRWVGRVWSSSKLKHKNCHGTNNLCMSHKKGYDQQLETSAPTHFPVTLHTKSCGYDLPLNGTSAKLPDMCLCDAPQVPLEGHTNHSHQVAISNNTSSGLCCARLWPWAMSMKEANIFLFIWRNNGFNDEHFHAKSLNTLYTKSQKWTTPQYNLIPKRQRVGG